MGWNDSDQLQDYNLATLWNNGVRIDLSGGKASHALNINNSGVIVGDMEGRATLWNINGVAIDLNSLIPGTGWILNDAIAINDQGQIIGNGTINGETHSFLYTPDSSTNAPLPSSLLLFGPGLAGIAFMKRKFSA